MPRTLSPIPVGSAIVDRDGTITIFFRLRWQELIAAYTQIPTLALVELTHQHATIPATSAYTTLSSGWYRVSYSIHKTVADGVASSLTVTLGWIRGGVALSQAFAALTTDTTAAQQNDSIVVHADGATDIDYGIVYSSNTPDTMRFEVGVTVELLV